ncbi:YDG domain-containing protein, partial [Pelomonas sp. KK5]|uniref:YDG domain-containing protein n=1 Tax=Pelomonas sp. KK5 TaxID=1855730 RepID=UPI00097BBCA0
MNRIFKLVWSTAVNGWCVVSETVSARGKASRAGCGGGGSSASPWLAGLFFSIPIAALAAPPAANQLPTGGQVVAGQATVSANNAAAQLTVNQGTNRAAINWQSFDIGSSAKVTFNQPNAQSVTLNRVVGVAPSQIFGQLTANGSVYIVNPSGVLFAPGAQVDVGGLVASTMAISNDDFMAGKAVFSRNGSTASVVNLGQIKAADYIALLAPEVRNEGVLVAQAGTIALAAGEAVTLDFGPDSKLQGIAVTPAQIKTLVENRRAVIAEGGQIILASRAVDALLGSVVNSGTLSASSIVDKGGVVTITADAITLADSSAISADGTTGGRIQVGSMQSTQTSAAGTLSARGSSGAGGAVETSAQHLTLGAVAVDTTGATATGQWLLDPYDLTVGSSSASTISTNLATTNVTLQTTASGTSGPGTANASGSGDITINSAITWSSANTLTLDAYRNISINAAVTASGTGKVVMITGDTGGNQTSTGGDYSFNLGNSGFGGSLNFTGTANAGQALTINGNAYTLLYDMSATANLGLGSLNGKTTGYYALARNITSAGTTTASVVSSFGLSSGAHTGTFSGLGHTVDGLTINVSSGSIYGFFGTVYGTVRDFGITTGAINSSNNGITYMGLLAGQTSGATIKNVYSTGTVQSSNNSNSYGGGLIGQLATSSLDKAWSSASVSLPLAQDIGGLIGQVTTTSTLTSSVTNSYATGNVTSSTSGGGPAGGLIGGINHNGSVNFLGATVDNSYATGTVTSNIYTGGLIGYIQNGSTTNYNTISNSYATGTVTNGSGGYAGGLVGQAALGYTTFTNVHASGNVTTSGNNAGGLIGNTSGNYNPTETIIITKAYATGNVTGTSASSSSIGGLIGDSTNTRVSVSFSAGNVSAAQYFGGLIGAARNSTTLTDVYETGNVTSNGLNTPYAIGGLVGYVAGATVAITNAYSSGTTPTANSANNVAASIGQGAGSTLTNVYYDSTKEGSTAYGSSAPSSVTGGGAKTTSQLQNGTLPSGYSGTIWESTAGYYPYFDFMFPGGTMSISGTAYTSAGATANSGTVQLYANGSALFTLGGTITTNGSTGTYSALVGAGSVTASTKLAGTLTLNGAGSVSGLSYTDAPTTSGANVVGFDLRQGLFLSTTSDTTNSTLQTNLAGALGSSSYTSLKTTLDTALWQINASGNFSVDSALSHGGSSGLTAGGNLSLDAAVTATGSTLMLKAGGTVTDGASGAITATNLALLGGAVTLDGTSNNVTTLAASGVGSLSYTDSNSLTVDSLAGLNTGVTAASINGATTTVTGVAASGDVLLGSTGTNGLTINSAVQTSSAAADATITLRSGQNLQVADGVAVGGTGTNKANVVLWAGYSTTGFRGVAKLGNGTVDTKGGLFYLGGAQGTDSNGGVASYNGVSVPSSEAAAFVSGNPSGATLTGTTITTGGGDIVIKGRANVSSAASYVSGVDLHGATLSSGSGSIAITGTVNATSLGNSAAGITIDGATSIAATGAGTVAITGSDVRTNALTSFSRGVQITAGNGSNVAITTQSGALTVSGTDSSTGTTSDALRLENTAPATATLKITSASGDVTLSGNQSSGGATSGVQGIDFIADGAAAAGAIRIGADGASSYTGNLIVRGSTITHGSGTTATGAVTLNGTGSLTMDSPGTSFTQGFTLDSIYATGTTHTALTVGKSTNTAAVSLPVAQSAAGPVTISGGAVAIGASLSSTGSGSNNLITLSASTSATQSAGTLTASNLLLLRGGNFTLTQAGNAIGTLAASGVGNVSYVDVDALTLGSVGSTNGVSGSGTLNIVTTNGDLTVAQNVATTDTTSAAITLNAALSRAAGTATGGNIVVSGSPSITTGAGGRATLYSGSASGDTSLATLIGLGSGRFRYNSDESSTNYTTALGTGLYGIYRQSINTAVAASTASIVYGTATPNLLGSSGTVNGDTASVTVQSPVTSTSGKLVVNSYTVSPDVTALVGLGYTSSGNSSGTLTVTPKALSISGVTAVSRAYDGTTVATLGGSASIGGAISGDDVSLSGGSTGAFADKNVGTGKTVTVSYSLAGADAANYTAASAGAVTADITPKILTVGGVVANNKVYDGTTAATLSNDGSVSTGVGGETLTLSHGTASFADANVGAGKTVSVLDYALGNGSNGGVASNYQLSSTTATTTADIGTKALTVTANHDAKLVTQSDAAGYNGASYSGFVGADTAGSLGGSLVITRAGQGTDEAAGTYSNALVASGLSSSNYAISFVPGSYTVVAADTLLIKAGSQSVVYGSGLAYSVTAQYITAGNVIHTLTQTGGSGNNYVFSDGVGGTATVTLTPQGAVTSTGGYLNVGSYAIADAAPQRTGSNFTGFHFVGNADVTAKGVAVGTGTVTKVYDGTTTLTGVTLTPGGTMAGDALGVTGSGDFAQKNVGTGLTYTISGLALTQADAANYYLSGGSSLTASDGSITPKALTISGITASSKVYDQTVAATVDVSGAVFTGLVSGDAVTVSATGVFGNKNVGTGKTVTLTSLNGGADLGNYTVSNQAATSADITPKALTISGITAADRDYNGTTNATVSTGGIQYAGLIGGDVLAIASSTGTFADKHVGSGKTVSLANSYAGADLGNYTITDQAGTTASITPAAITVSAADLTKTYDGGTSAAGAAAAVVSGTLFTGDTLVGGSFAYADKNAGIGNKTVTVSGVTISDGNSGNDYTLTLVDNTTSTINRAALSYGGLTASNKVYDGNTTASVVTTGGAFTGLIGGDDVTLGSASGTFDTKNVGTGKTVSLSASYAGADVGNYTITTQASTTADITPATLTISGITAAGKVYDGTNAATVSTSGAVYGGLVSGDLVSVSATGVFSDKNAATGKTVTLSSSYSGADTGNYTIVDQASTTADITPKALTISGLTVADRTYNGTDVASLITSGAVRSGLVSGDVVTISATGQFADKNVGTAKAIALSSSYGGADAGNYAITDQAATTASITPATLVLTAANLTKTYDSTTAATGATAAVGSGTLFSGDTLSGGSFAYADKNFGIGNKTLTVSGVTVNDGNGGANYTVSYASNTTSTINKAGLTISGITAADKVYDGTVNATVSTTGAVYSGLFGGDVVVVSATGAFTDANAGVGKTVNLSSSYSGADVNNYTITSQPTALATIFTKGLVVTANDDARFVTQSDNAGFNGVHYTGFVGGDTAASLNTSGLAVTRPNAGTDVAAGVYSGALVPSGVTSSNYNVTFANGTYTILAANNALVKTVNVDTPYGVVPTYTVASVQYMDGSNVISSLTQTSHTGNSYGYTDGVGGTLSFTLGPSGATTSTSGRVVVGNYTIADAAPVIGGGNLAGPVTFIGNEAVQQAAVTVSAGGVSKVYDGNTSMSGVTLSLNGQYGGDVVTVSGTGAFSQKNVGTNLSYTVSGLTLGGADGGNYYVTGGTSLAGSDGSITPKALTVSGITAANKTYDGTNSATVSGAGVSFGGLVAGDNVTLSSLSGAFTDKNAGIGKTVNLSESFGGTDAGNYTITPQATTTATINPLALTISGSPPVSGLSKVYDGTTLVPIDTTGVSLVGVLGGDQVGLSAQGNTADKNVGINLPLTIAALLGGTDGGNYSVTGFPTVGSVTVSPKALTISGITAADRPYDQTTNATVNTTGTVYAGLVSGDQVTIASSGSFGDAHAGVGKTVNLTNTYGGTDAGNYAITDQPTTTATITPLTITPGGTLPDTSALTKVYDGTTNVPIDTSGITLGGVLPGDQVGVSASGTTADKNVGTNLPVSVSGGLTGANAGDYVYVFPISSGLVTVTPRALVLGGITAADKVYDSTLAATLGFGSATFTGVVSGDTVGYSTNGLFSDKNVGTAKTVNLNAALTGADAGNYTLTGQTSTTASITPLMLSLSGLPDTNGLTKTYDGTVNVPIDTSGVTLGGLLPGDQLGLSASGTTADKNVGVNLPVTIASLLTGADAGNYAFTGFPSSGLVTVSPKALVVSGITAASRAYDQTTSATLSLAGISYAGLVAGDQFSVSATGSFADAHAGVGKTVSIVSTHNGADAGNYTVTDQATTTATITPLTITAGGTLPDTSGLTKVYDGTTNVPIDTSGITLGGILPGDQVGVSASGTTPDKNVGNNIPVSVTGGLTGANAGDYVYVFPISSGLVTVTPKALVLAGITALDKVYDATMAATLRLGNATFSGVVSGDVVGYSTDGRFSDKNVGAAKTVSLNAALTGADAANYTLTGQTTTTASITPLVLSLSGLPDTNGLTKTYDGTTLVPIDTSGVHLGGLLPGDQLGLSASGTTADKNVGVNLPVSITSLLTGADAGNYAFTGFPGSGLVTVSPKALVVSGITADNKVYDATIAATVNTGAATLAGLIAGDQLSLGATGSFADKNAGTGKTVNLSSTYSGADVGNYAITSQATTTANITPRTITVDNLPGSGNGGATDFTKTYDGTTNVPINTSGVTIGGVLPGDSVGYGATGTTADKNAGNDKAVTITGGLTGPDAGNYQVTVPTTATGTVDVLPKTVTVIGTVVLPKIFDGTTSAGLTGSILSPGDVVPGDQLSLTNAGTGQFADPNPGTNKPVTTNIGLGGADAGNYAIVQPQGLTGTISNEAVIVLPPAPPTG